VSSSSPLLRVRGLSAAWGATPVLRDVSFEVAAGEYFVLLGPNGSGKSTLLRLLAGLERPTAGTIELDGENLADRPTHRRGIGLMFQDPALFPHRTVFENIAYAPMLQRRPTAEVDTEVRELVHLLRLEGFEDRSPDALSGGERQRVALARTLAARPKLVMLDEPFASIDVDLRAELRAEFRDVLRDRETAAIHVTHDREEGLFLAGRLGLLFEGRLATVGTPESVFGQPPDARSARFLGYNVGVVEGRAVGVDPRDVRLASVPPGVPCTVATVGPVGRERVAVLRTVSGDRWEARGTEGLDGRRSGEAVFVRWDRSVELPDDPNELRVRAAPSSDSERGAAHRRPQCP
jgi:ABC-type Fe3+/spermidine/putrescine transport system ATPase subunit